jgi:hypothetical protein
MLDPTLRVLTAGYTGPHNQMHPVSGRSWKGRLGGAAKATEAIADAMGAKGHRIMGFARQRPFV